MTGARNLPQPWMLNSDDGTLKSNKDLKKVFSKVNVDLNEPAIFFCNTGTSASVNALAFSILSEKEDEQV